MAAIYYTDDAGNEVRFEIPAGSTSVSIGRGANNDLRIRKPSISRRHAELAADGAMWTFVDLGSSNGSWVDGERMQPQQIKPLAGGAKLKCGEVHLRFEGGIASPLAAEATAAVPGFVAAGAGPPPGPPPMAAEPAPPPPAPPAPTFEPPPPIAAPPVAPPPPAPPPPMDAAPAAPPPPVADPFGEPPPPVPGLGEAASPPVDGDDPMAGLDFPDAPDVLDDSLVDLFGDAAQPSPEPPAAAPDPTPAPELSKEGTESYDKAPDVPEPADPVSEMPPVDPADLTAPPPGSPDALSPPEVAPPATDDFLDIPDEGDEDPFDLPDPPAPDDEAQAPPSAPEPVDKEPSRVMQAIGDAEADLFGDDPSPADGAEDGGGLEALPELPEEPSARARLLEDLLHKTRKELETKSRRVNSLQKAARRDVDTKKRLQDAKREADAGAETAITELDGVTTERDTLREDVARLNDLLAKGEAGVSEIESQLQETRADLDTVRVERDDLSRQNAVMGAELDERPTDEQVDALQAQIDDLQGQLAIVTTERDQTLDRAAQADGFESQVTSLTAENESLAQSLKAAPTPERYKEMDLELRALRRDAGSGAGKAVVLEKNLKDAIGAAKSFKAKARKTFEELGATLKTLDAEKTAAQRELESLKASFADASASGDDATQKIADLRIQVDTLTGGHEALGRSLDEASGRADAAEERSAALETDLESLRADADGALSASDAEALKGELDELKTEHDGATADLEETKAALAEAENQLNELQGVAEAAEEGLGAELSRLKGESVALEERASAAEGLANDVQGKLETAEAEATAAKEALAEMEAEIGILRKAGDAAMGDVEAERGEARKVQADLESAQAKVEELEGTVEALRMATGGEGAAPAADGEAPPAEVTDLIERINDVVSNWKNNFMHISNFLLDVRNGLDMLKQDNADVAGVVEEMQASGTAEEMQDLMQRCEDESRELKKDLRGFRE